jgi:hypothetical protein
MLIRSEFVEKINEYDKKVIKMIDDALNQSDGYSERFRNIGVEVD